MSWLDVLYQTYENCYGVIEVTHTMGAKPKKPLLPPFHTLQNSHIEVTIDGNGNFIDASFIEDKNDREIIIPCTEKSASRTSGEEPHPLCDKIQYCAKDYSGNKKSYFNSYSKIIEEWYCFDKKNIFLKAIYLYVQRGTLYHDILKTGKEFGKPNKDVGDYLIRWRVNIPTISENRCWKNNQLFESWQRFSESQESIEDICMVTGIKKPIAINHPKRIRNSGDGAKLISSNDRTGFTFLGRFLLNDFNNEKVSNQAASISVEISQKAHSALRWLIDRQSFRNGDQVIVSWSVTGEEKPNEFSDTNELFGDSDEEKIVELNTYTPHDAGQTFANKLTKKIAGYRGLLDDSKKIVVMGLDSVGPGRISITFYRELTGSEFLDRVEKWHSDMAWHFLEFVKDPSGKKKFFSGHLVYAPAPRLIAEVCFGKRLDDKLKKTTIERLLPCIIDGRQIPEDLVNVAVKRASNKIGIDYWEWERTLSVACALYSCQLIRKDNKTKKIMSLEKERFDRDYLYGRLLAIAEHLEEIALNVAKESRETTAARLMQRFADFPFSTWRTIESSLVPYKSRLNVNRPGFLINMKKLLDEVHSMFLPGDFENDSRLSGSYLLGYHCQRLAFKSKNPDEVENNN